MKELRVEGQITVIHDQGTRQPSEVTVRYISDKMLAQAICRNLGIDIRFAGLLENTVFRGLLTEMIKQYVDERAG